MKNKIKQSDLNKSNSYHAIYPGTIERDIKVPNEWVHLTPKQKQKIRPDDMYYNPQMNRFVTVNLVNENGSPMNYVFQIRKRATKKVKYRTIGALGIDFKTIIKRKIK